MGAHHCLSAAVCVVLALFIAVAVGTEDAPIGAVAVHNHQVFQSKFNVREQVMSQQVLYGTDVSLDHESTCPSHGVALLWSTEVGASVYATPLITDLFSDGRPDIVVPTFTHYVEVLNGMTGDDAQGWPYSHPSVTTQSSPLLTDLDADGTSEIVLTTFNAEVIFFRESGEPIAERTIKIHPLRVKKDWYKKFEGDRNDVEQMNKYEENLKQRRAAASKKNVYTWERPPHQEDPKPHIGDINVDTISAQGVQKSAQAMGDGDAAQAQPDPNQHQQQQAHPHRPGARTLQQVGDDAEEALAGGEDYDGEMQAPKPYGEGDGAEDGAHHHDNGYYGDEDEENYYARGIDGLTEETGVPEKVTIGVDAGLSPEALQSMDLVYHPELFASAIATNLEKDPFSLAQVLVASLPKGSDEVLVDAHILSTPVIVDLDLDGGLELIAAVTYYFDEHHYAKPENAGQLPEGVLPENYVANGLVVVNLINGEVKWSKQLDMTTRGTKFQAMMFSSPTVVDADSDGMLDIFVGTSMGMLYAFDHRGRQKPGWPIVMAEIQAQVLAEDVNGDGKIDICAADMQSNVACFTADGKEIWERQVSGGVPQAPVAGDVNGDGFLDVVVTTTSGHVWALDGRTGDVLPHFPFRTGNRIVASALLLNMNTTEPPMSPEAMLGLHLVVPSHDGYLYIISGRSGCTEKIDIGEKVYSMVLAEDVTKNGFMDLVVATMSGNVMLFESTTEHHPLKAWPAQLHSLNGLTAQEGNVGIYISQHSRVTRDVVGDHFKLVIDIVDERHLANPHHHRIYYVTITIGRRMLMLARSYHRPGQYIEYVATPLERMYATVYVHMRTETGQIYEDQVALSFNMHFMETIKWLLIIPFCATCLALSLVKAEHRLKPVALGPGGRGDPYASFEDYEEDYYEEMAAEEGRRRAQQQAARTQQPPAPAPAPATQQQQQQQQPRAQPQAPPGYPAGYPQPPPGFPQPPQYAPPPMPTMPKMPQRGPVGL